MLIALRGG